MATGGAVGALTLLGGWRTWQRIRRAWRRWQAKAVRDTPGFLAALPTDRYQHWFAEHLIADFLAAGWPREMFGYTGVTAAGRYDKRCLEHAGVVGDQPSWWWGLVDQSLSTITEHPFPNRAEAETSEAAHIRTYCGVGNITHNPRYREQTVVRELLRQRAMQVALAPQPARPARRRLLVGAR